MVSSKPCAGAPEGCGLLSVHAPDISVGQVCRSFESSVLFAECFAGEDNTCPLTDTCRLRGFINRAMEAFYHELDMVTLDDLVRGNCGLEANLKLAPQPPSICSETNQPGSAA